MSFLLRISLVNVTKFAVSCGFGHITEEILNGKLDFLQYWFQKINKQLNKFFVGENLKSLFLRINFQEYIPTSKSRKLKVIVGKPIILT